MVSDIAIIVVSDIVIISIQPTTVAIVAIIVIIQIIVNIFVNTFYHYRLLRAVKIRTVYYIAQTVIIVLVIGRRRRPLIVN